MSVREAPASLDPADSRPPGILPNVSRLIFDTLVTLDGQGQTQPALSTSWKADPGNQRWQFDIRRGVTFHDGSTLTSDVVAASLRAANSNWKVFAAGDAVVIQCDAPTPDLPAVLALPRYGIAKRSSAKISGSGPFAIDRWEPGKKLTLTARDDYWGGRAFVDSIDIELGKSFHEQMIALDLGKADVIEVPPDQARHAALEGRDVEISAPAEWMALAFNRDVQSVDDGKLRQALGLSIDRESMNNVLLPSGAEPAGTLLPGWLTGYAFLFPTAVDMQRARQLRGEVPTSPSWTLGYDASDSLSRVIAERVALNARDAGLTLQAAPFPNISSAGAEVLLIRTPLPSLDPQVALSEIAAKVGLPQPPPQPDSDPATCAYVAESALLQSQRVIPLLHLKVAVALGANVRGWQQDPAGAWSLPDIWLEAGKP